MWPWGEPQRQGSDFHSTLEPRISEHMALNNDHQILLKVHPKPNGQKILAANAHVELGYFQRVETFPDGGRLELQVMINCFQRGEKTFCLARCLGAIYQGLQSSADRFRVNDLIFWGPITDHDYCP